MSSREKLHIGIIGAGEIVKQRHLPALKAMPDVEITAVCNSTYTSSKRFCDEHLPHATPMKNWADMLAVPEISIIWIGAPPYVHAAATISALEAGKHVFCQARMAMNFAEAEEMLAAAHRYPHLVTMLCPPPHGMLGDLVMQRLLRNGVIGQPHHLRLRSLSSQFLDPDAPAHWRQRSEISGLNVLTLGIYAEVLQRWLGPITSVSARAKTVHPVRQGYEIKIPDLLTVLCHFVGGIEGVLEFSGVAAFPSPDRLELYGSEGKLSYDFSSDNIEAATLADGSMKPQLIRPEDERHWRVEEEFVAAVRNPHMERPHPTFDDGVAYMRVVQAVADSVAQHRMIEIRT
jgi:predicted dehydrogenase